MVSLLYSNFPEAVSSELQAHLCRIPIWCGGQNFCQKDTVLYNDDPRIATNFGPAQLSFVWFPDELPNSKKDDIIRFLHIKALSSVMTNRVEARNLQTAASPSLPFFPPLVRYVMCCWCYTKAPQVEWEKISKLLQTEVEEQYVTSLEVVQCARVNGADVMSTSVQMPNSFLDMECGAKPILYRLVRSRIPASKNQDMLVDEFCDHLASILHLVEDLQHDAFCYIISSAIRNQKQNAVAFRLEIEKKFRIPPVCMDEASTAYLPPIPEKERTKILSPAIPPQRTLSFASLREFSQGTLQNMRLEEVERQEWELLDLVKNFEWDPVLVNNRSKLMEIVSKLDGMMQKIEDIRNAPVCHLVLVLLSHT